MNIEEDIKIVNKMIEKSNIEDTDMNDILQTREIEAIENILEEYKRVKQENESLKLFIANNPDMNLDSAIAYKNLRMEAYIAGKAEERERAKQFISANCIIMKQNTKDDIYNYQKNIAATSKPAFDARLKNEEEV